MKHYKFTIEFNGPDLTQDKQHQLYLRGKALVEQFAQEVADILDGASVDVCLMSKSEAEQAN